MLSGMSQAFAIRHVLINERVELLCPFEKFDSIQWKREHQTSFEIIDSNIHLPLAITSLNDSGNYTCIADNPAGTSQFTYKIIVNSPPHVFVDQIPTIHTNESTNNIIEMMKGNSLLLHCKANGFPTPKVRRSFDNFRPFYL